MLVKMLIIKWLIVEMPAAPPRLPAAFALPADENEVLFPMNRANGKTAAAAVAAPAHVA